MRQKTNNEGDTMAKSETKKVEGGSKKVTKSSIFTLGQCWRCSLTTARREARGRAWWTGMHSRIEHTALNTPDFQAWDSSSCKLILCTKWCSEETINKMKKNKTKTAYQPNWYRIGAGSMHGVFYLHRNCGGQKRERIITMGLINI